MEGDDELGPCTRCDHGWVTVGQGYVHEQARLPDPSAHVLVPDEHHEEWLKQRTAALADTVYPCKVCRPGAFMRWVKGYPAAVEGDEGTTVVRRRRRR